ncbi:MAG: FMN-binding protein [Candidatus Omnitrophica bacterium]|nr:FMN-binding protein [Candidatus Omnitrophota bacterium]
MPAAEASEAEREPEGNARNEIYLTPEEALEKAFAGADRIEKEVIRLSPEAEARVARAVGHPLYEREFVLYRGIKAGNLLGTAMMGEELGKFRPITSMTVVGPDGKVQDVKVLVYRESHGSDVRRKRFLYQYFGKGRDDPIQINQDITSISGATISVRSMNAQVRKALNVIYEASFKKSGEKD